MKRIAALICALCIFLTCAHAESAWSPEVWTQLKETLAANEPVPEQYRVTIKKDQVYLANPAEKSAEWFSLLILSTDTQDIRKNFGRTEAMLVCRINKKTGEIRMLSLPEYALAALPGQTEQIQLKYMSCFGGPLLAMSTVNQSLALSLNRYCAVNVNSFARIVDSIGGVTLELTEEEAAALGTATGPHTLTGEEVVHYVQFRRQWEGGQRFRMLVEAVLVQAANGSMLNAALTVIDMMLSGLDTNLTIDEMVDLAFTLFGGGGLKDSHVMQLYASESDTIDSAVVENCRSFLFD